MIRKLMDTYTFARNWLSRVLILCLLLCPLTMTAQRIKKVCGEYTYYAEGHESINEAKMKALEGAKMKAIANEFGTIIAQTTSQTESVDDGEEHSFFSQLNSSEVKGEWLEDVGEAKYDISFTDNMLIVKCRICGHARETTNRAIEFEATVLRNHPELKDANVHFKNGDDMFLHFQAPSNGYVAVYLVDETPTAYCLLPYMSDTDGQQIVKGGKEYIFFSIAQAAAEKELVDEYTLTCNGAIERNKIYVIFSKKPFTKAVDHKVGDALPKQLSYADFSHWLGRQRAHDPEMGVKVMHVEIKK